MKNNMSPLVRLLDSLDSKLKLLGNWLTKHLLFAIKHLPDKEESIYKVFKASVLILFLSKKSLLCKNKISYMLECQPKSKWTTFLDNLNSSKNPNTLPIQLLQILLQELILKEKAFRPFWIPACKDLSEKLLLPTGTDFVGLDSISSNNWFPKQVEQLQSYKKTTIELQNKNLQKTFCPLFMSSLVDKWENEVMPTVKLKTIKIYPRLKQKQILNKFIDTSRYVYNRTNEYIKNGHRINFQDLRDLLVTENTKKDMDDYKMFDNLLNHLKQQKKDKSLSKENIKLIEENIKIVNQNRRNYMKQFEYIKNPLIRDFETETPKDIRACAVKRCCDAYKTGFANLRNGNIKYFNMTFKKKTDKIQSIELTPKIISIKNGIIKIAPEFFGKECNLKTHKKLNYIINHNVDIVRRYKEYYIHLSVNTEPTESKLNTIAGVDPGIRTFATVHSHNENTTIITEYKHNIDLLKKLNLKLNLLKKNS